VAGVAGRRRAVTVFRGTDLWKALRGLCGPAGGLPGVPIAVRRDQPSAIGQRRGRSGDGDGHPRIFEGGALEVAQKLTVGTGVEISSHGHTYRTDRRPLFGRPCDIETCPQIHAHVRPCMPVRADRVTA
jgi:hypothetical protein